MVFTLYIKKKMKKIKAVQGALQKKRKRQKGKNGIKRNHREQIQRLAAS